MSNIKSALDATVTKLSKLTSIPRPIHQDVGISSVIRLNPFLGQYATQTPTLTGVTFFAFIYAQAKAHHASDPVPGAFLGELPPRLFRVYGPSLDRPDTLSKIIYLVNAQPGISKQVLFPILEMFLHLLPNQILPEMVYPDYHLVKAQKTKEFQHMISMSRLQTKRGRDIYKKGEKSQVLCGSTDARYLGGFHDVRGSVCINCGMVVQTVQHLAVEEHMTRKRELPPTKLPRQRRYEFRSNTQKGVHYLVMPSAPLFKRAAHSRVPVGVPLGYLTMTNGKHPEEQVAVARHWANFKRSLGTFHVRVLGKNECIPIKLTPEFKDFLTSIWSMCVHADFSPSKDYSSKIVVYAYYIWKIIHPKLRMHYLDTYFVERPVVYLAHQGTQGDPSELYFPRQQVNYLKYTPMFPRFYAAPTIMRIWTNLHQPQDLHRTYVPVELPIHPKPVKYVFRRQVNTSFENAIELCPACLTDRTIVPTGSMDVEVKIRFVVRKLTSKMPEIHKVRHNNRECKLLRTSPTQDARDKICFFHVEWYNPKYPMFRIEFNRGYPAQEIMVPIRHAKNHEIQKTKSFPRSRLLGRIQPLKLTLVQRMQRFNPYNPTPISSPFRVPDQAKLGDDSDEEEEDEPQQEDEDSEEDSEEEDPF